MMQHDILFRGRDVKTHKWVQGSYIRRERPCIEHWEIASDGVPEPFISEVEPDTLGMYFGLHDVAGKRIFEGDLITILDSSKQGLPGVVHWYRLSCTFAITRQGFNPIPLDGEDAKYLIIGNVFDE